MEEQGQNRHWKSGSSERKSQKALPVLLLLGSVSFALTALFFNVNWCFDSTLTVAKIINILKGRRELLLSTIPQLLDTLCTFSRFTPTPKKDRSQTIHIRPEDWRQQNNRCTVWEGILNEVRGQGDPKILLGKSCYLDLRGSIQGSKKLLNKEKNYMYEKLFRLWVLGFVESTEIFILIQRMRVKGSAF